METCPVCTVTLIVVGVVLVLALVGAVLAFGTFRDAIVVVPAQVAAVEMPKPVPVQVCGQAYLAAQQVHVPIQAVQTHALRQVCIQPAPPAPLPAPPPPPPPPSCSPVYIQPPEGSRQVCIQAPPGQQPVFVLR